VNVEQIDLRGGGANVLTLAMGDVLAISATATLKVLGDVDDTVDAIGFAPGGDAPVGFVSYTSGGATLLVDEDVTVNLIPA
jgi:hypothetical protein